ncbi:hypothetical protein OROHE_018869 [Orobanche hederae]
MGFLFRMPRVGEFFARNPALDFAGSLVIISAMVMPLWIANGPNPKKPPVEDFE